MSTPNIQDVWEVTGSRDRSRSRVDGKIVETRLFKITGYDDAVDAEAALIASTECPFAIGPEADLSVLRRFNISVTPSSDGQDVWDAAVQYESTSDLNYTFSGSTSGGSFTITQGLAVTAYGAPSITPPNFQGAINVTENGVEGVEIVVPQFEFSITKTKATGTVTLAYCATLLSLTGKTNNAAWQGFNEGELLFLGADFSAASGGEVSVTYKFVASPNRTGLTVGPITGIAKKGHEYLWVLYRPNQSGNFLVKVPVAVYVHQVYESGNFNLLGI